MIKRPFGLVASLACLWITTSLCTAALQDRRQPNILLLITDDQDVLLGGIEHMPILQRDIVARGVNFRHAFVHTPICCPSRSSILVRRAQKKQEQLRRTSCNSTAIDPLLTLSIFFLL